MFEAWQEMQQENYRSVSKLFFFRWYGSTIYPSIIRKLAVTVTIFTSLYVRHNDRMYVKFSSVIKKKIRSITEKTAVSKSAFQVVTGKNIKKWEKYKNISEISVDFSRPGKHFPKENGKIHTKRWRKRNSRDFAWYPPLPWPFTLLVDQPGDPLPSGVVGVRVFNQ